MKYYEICSQDQPNNTRAPLELVVVEKLRERSDCYGWQAGWRI